MTPAVASGALAQRIATVVAGVVAGVARDARRSRLFILDAGTPEAELLAGWLEHAGLEARVERVRGGADQSAEDLLAEARRAAGRDGLVLDPVNKTVAVLWPETVAAPVLPLADLYATQIARLVGGWSAPAHALGTIERAGGIEPVDDFLAAHLEQRRPLDRALRSIAPAAAAELRERLGAGWWWRRRLGVVPKLGARTLGIDLR